MMEDGGGGLGKDSPMERFYDCTNCMKTFKVSSVTEPSAEIPETKVSVTCPVCNTPNTITLPQGAKFIVTPPN
jgi:DNA-directed RNA polymerase subunit RPC12/RpoP